MYATPAERRLYRRKIGRGIVAFGGVVLTVCATLFQLNPATPWVYEARIGGLGFIAFGIIQILVACKWPRDRISDNHRCRFARADEIDAVYNFVISHLGPDLLEKRQFQEMLELKPDLCYVIESKEDNPKSEYKLVGVFTLIPLKQGAVHELEEGNLTGRGLRAANIAKKKGSAKAFYLGVVIGTDLGAKAYVIMKTKEELARLCKQNTTTKVFGRPITDDGLRLMIKYGFKRVNRLDEPKMNFVCFRHWPP